MTIPRPRRHRERHRDERGAVAVVVAVLMSFVFIAIAAFTVDIGMQRVLRRDMQALADVVALDLARLLDGRRRNDIERGSDGRPSLTSALEASVRNNDTTTVGGRDDCDHVVGYAEVTTVGDSCVYVYLVKLDEPDGPDDPPYPLVAHGSTPRPQNVGNSPGHAPDGVVVIASSSVDFVFGLADNGSATRSAVGSAESTACLGIGSYAARLDSESSTLLHGVLGTALGGSLGVDLVSYRGLADVDLQLGDLAASAGAGSVTGLLETDVGYDALLIAAADVLRQDGNTADAAVLEAIAATVEVGTISLGELIAVTPDGAAAESARINVLDLVTGSAFIANGSRAIEISEVATELGLSGTALAASLTVIQNPQLACGVEGETVAETSQVDLRIDGTLADTTLPGLGLGVSVGGTSIDVGLANATGTLTDMTCGEGVAGNPESIDVSVSSGLLQASLTQRAEVSGSLTGGVLNDIIPGLAGLVDVTIGGEVAVTVSTNQPGETDALEISHPPTEYGEPVATGSGALGLDTASATVDTSRLTIDVELVGSKLLADILGIKVGDVSSAVLDEVVAELVSGVVAPLVADLNVELIGPLTDLLGVTIGGADVFLPGPPSCSDPRLVG